MSRSGKYNNSLLLKTKGFPEKSYELNLLLDSYCRMVVVGWLLLYGSDDKAISIVLMFDSERHFQISFSIDRILDKGK